MYSGFVSRKKKANIVALDEKQNIMKNQLFAMTAVKQEEEVFNHEENIK